MFTVKPLTPSKSNTVIKQQKVAGLIGNNRKRVNKILTQNEVKQQVRQAAQAQVNSDRLGYIAEKLQGKFARLA